MLCVSDPSKQAIVLDTIKRFFFSLRLPSILTVYLREKRECACVLHMERHSPVWNRHTLTTLIWPVWPDASNELLPFSDRQDTFQQQQKQNKYHKNECQRTNVLETGGSHECGEHYKLVQMHPIHTVQNQMCFNTKTKMSSDISLSKIKLDV